MYKIITTVFIIITVTLISGNVSANTGSSLSFQNYDYDQVLSYQGPNDDGGNGGIGHSRQGKRHGHGHNHGR